MNDLNKNGSFLRSYDNYLLHYDQRLDNQIDYIGNYMRSTQSLVNIYREFEPKPVLENTQINNQENNLILLLL
jgi:hypothetical protein